MIYLILIAKALLEVLIIIGFTTGIVAIMVFVEERYYNWKKRKRERQLEKEYIERELCKKEQERYPLFFLKEGIV